MEVFFFCIFWYNTSKEENMNIKERQAMIERYRVILSIGLIIAISLLLNFCSGTNKEAERWHNKGNALYNLGRNEEAIKAYEKAIEIKPDFNMVHLAWNNKGNAFSNLGRHEEALKAFEKAIEIKPDYHHAWYNKGVALYNFGRPEEALKALEKAIEIKPDYHLIHQAWTNKGVALYDLGRPEEALKAYEKAIEINPDYHLTWYNLACFYSLKKDKDKALKYLQKAIENGYNDLSHIKKDNDLDFIKNETEFKKIIDKL
jgi:tetratricopeptide (TPR) repeat protein